MEPKTACALRFLAGMPGLDDASTAKGRNRRCLMQGASLLAVAHHGPRYREARSTKRGPVSVRVVSKKIVERLDGRRKPRTDFCAVDYCTVVVTRGWSMKTVLASNPRMGKAISAALGRIWSCTVRDD